MVRGSRSYPGAIAAGFENEQPLIREMRRRGAATRNYNRPVCKGSGGPRMR